MSRYTYSELRERGRVAFWHGKALMGNPWMADQKRAWVEGWKIAEAEFKAVTKGARRTTPGLLTRHMPDYAKGKYQPVSVVTRRGSGLIARQNKDTHIFVRGDQ